MLEYLVYVLKCMGCLSAMAVILFLTIQLIYVNPKKQREKDEIQKMMMNNFSDKLLEKIIEENDEN